jgi:hypothetical protein
VSSERTNDIVMCDRRNKIYKLPGSRNGRLRQQVATDQTLCYSDATSQSGFNVTKIAVILFSNNDKDVCAFTIMKFASPQYGSA